MSPNPPRAGLPNHVELDARTARVADPDVLIGAQRLDCGHRAACLDHAARCDWDALDCGSCDAFKPIDHEALRADLEGLARFGAALTAVLERDEEAQAKASTAPRFGRWRRGR